MQTITITSSMMIQVVIALGLLNVWLLRSSSPTSYRGGSAKSLKEEFSAYGLPGWFFYLVGLLKINSAICLIGGIWIPQLVLPSAAVIAGLMLGALAMHVKVKDAMIKSLPAFVMLLMSSAVLFLTSTQ